MNIAICDILRYFEVRILEALLKIFTPLINIRTTSRGGDFDTLASAIVLWFNFHIFNL